MRKINMEALPSLNNYKKIVELYQLTNQDDSMLKVFYANDYPIPFKDDLLLYPVQVDLYYCFHLLVECLLLPHLTSGDVNAISMSYLEYLFYLCEKKNDVNHILYLNELLLIVFKKDNTYIDSDGNEKSTISMDFKNRKLTICGIEITHKEFDFVRKIILEQNAIEVPDESLPPELVKAFKEKEEFRLKQSKLKMCSFEDQINVVVAKSSYRRDEIMTMTIRSFTRLLTRVDKIMAYEISTLLSPNMEKKDREKIPHYMESIDSTLKERYEKEFTDMDSLKKKVEI